MYKDLPDHVNAMFDKITSGVLSQLLTQNLLKRERGAALHI